jgi:hypothetical protein
MHRKGHFEYFLKIKVTFVVQPTLVLGLVNVIRNGIGPG